MAMNKQKKTPQWKQKSGLVFFFSWVVLLLRHYTSWKSFDLPERRRAAFLQSTNSGQADWLEKTVPIFRRKFWQCSKISWRYRRCCVCHGRLYRVAPYRPVYGLQKCIEQNEREKKINRKHFGSSNFRQRYFRRRTTSVGV